jgi:hypothetical protein
VVALSLRRLHVDVLTDREPKLGRDAAILLPRPLEESRMQLGGNDCGDLSFRNGSWPFLSAPARDAAASRENRPSDF